MTGTIINYDTAANWSASNTVLAAGEIACESDTFKLKVGDGTTAWNLLRYSGEPVQSVAGKTNDVTLNYSDISGFSVVAHTGSYEDLINKPQYISQFINDLGFLTSGSSSLVTSVAGKTGPVTLTASDIGGLAPVATSGSYNSLSNKPSLSAVALSGSYADLSNKPSLATVATSGSYADLTNKPSLFDGTWSSLSGKPTFATVATSGSYNDLSNTPSAVTWSTLSGKPTFATVATSGSYNDLSSTPTLGTAAAANTGTSSGNVPVLDSNGKISTSVLPALAITEVYVVADATARDALTVQEGDVAIVSGLSQTFIYDGSAWQLIKSPTAAVSSVAGRTGAVTLSSSDISGLATSATTDTTNASNITSGTLSNSRLSSVPNSALANSSIIFGTATVSLGGTISNIAGVTINSTTIPSSKTLVTTGDTGTVTNTMLAGSIANNKLSNSSITFGTTSQALGSTITDIAGVTINSTTIPSSATLATQSYVTGLGYLTSISSSNVTTALGYTPANPAAAQNWTKTQSSSLNALTYSGSITPDFSAGNDFTLTLAGTPVINNPSNMTVGQKGLLIITQGGTQTVPTWGSYWNWGAQGAPNSASLSAANKTDRIWYHVMSSTSIHCGLGAGGY